jgi:hypothetical protein
MTAVNPITVSDTHRKVPNATPNANAIPSRRPISIEVPMIARMFGPGLIKASRTAVCARSIPGR